MPTFPRLETERLKLRAIRSSDKFRICDLAGKKDIAATTLHIPHPYTLSDAEVWISEQHEKFKKEETIAWAICPMESNALIGSIGLRLNTDYESAEIGFWIGRPFWGKGYITEAARRVVTYGFDELGLNRMEAHYMVGNEGSRKVLEKLGMQYEGLHRQLIKKWDEFKDVKSYAVLKSDRTYKRDKK